MFFRRKPKAADADQGASVPVPATTKAVPGQDPPTSREPPPAPSRASAGDALERRSSFLQRLSERRKSRDHERQKSPSAAAELAQRNAQLQSEVERLGKELAEAQLVAAGWQAECTKLQDYAQRAVRHLQEAERQKQEAENMHVLKLELLVDMWAASLIDAQTNAAGNDPSRVADIRASIARSLQEYSKLSDKLSDISLRDSAHASF